MKTDTNHADVLTHLLDIAKKAGASSADAVLSRASSLSINRRLGKQESLHRSEESEIGLRVFVGKRNAMVSTSDLSAEALHETAARAVAMAKSVPEDDFAGIAEAGDLAKTIPDLDLFDPTELDVKTMNEYADRAEQAALGTKGITNSEGAEFSFGRDETFYAATNGFFAGYPSSGFSLSVSVIAGEDLAMEVEYDYDSAVYLSDLKSPEEIGQEAARRAVEALNPQKSATKKVPVVFDQRIAGSLIGALAGAISGSAVARGTTLLKDKMGAEIFAPHISIIDDPFMRRGTRSRPFDGEGLSPQKRALINKGVLTGWVLDLASARQLKLTPTGNAARGTGSPPAPRVANFYMTAGTLSPTALIGEIEEGFYVTQFLGGGGNIVTGDYSRGAKGFWIKGGKITHPVSEMTIAGDLPGMWRSCTPANDLLHKTGVDAPTVRIDGMTVAGA